MKKALIFGITGQDGSYLAEFLLKKGYEVHGFIRHTSTGNKKNIKHFEDKIKLHKGDLADSTSIYRVIQEVMPNEIYNEADQDHAGWSYSTPDYSYDITAAAPGRILEAIKQINPKIKYFQPVSSHMFGTAQEKLTEESKFNPQSPYACAKTLAYYIVRYYRNVHGLFASTGIFFNHESPRRTADYVTRKISKAAARISLGLQKEIYLGDLTSENDWGYAPEYMEAAYNIMQLEKPDDFIICTGETHTVQEFLDEAFKQVNLNPKDYVKFDERFSRPSKINLKGNNTKAKTTFGFDPKIKFKELVKIMVEHDLKKEKKNI